MGTQGPASDAPRKRVRRVFADLAEPHRPLTAAEVADDLAISEGTARDALEALAADGPFFSRDLSDDQRIWWRGDGSTVDDGAETEEFGAFVRAVEDYAIFMLDPDGVVASWNEGAERIKGYSEGDIVGNHFSTFYTEEDVEAGVPERNLQVALDRGRVEDEGWRVREDGTRFWANVTITAIRDEDGELRGFTKVTRDMTEQREYEQKLRRERDFTEQVLETVPVSVFVAQADGEIIRANQQVLDRLGVDASELTDYEVASWTIYDEDDAEIPPEEWPWLDVVETGVAVDDFECQIDLPGTGRRWLSVNAAPLEGNDDGAERVVFSVDDVTERKERERRLRREVTQTEELLRTAPVAIAVEDADGNTVIANDRAQETLGVAADDLATGTESSTDWTIYGGNGEPLAPDEMPAARVLASGDPTFNRELRIERPADDAIHMRINAAPIEGPDGDVERVITAGEDVTELKERERQLEQRKSELETELSDILGRISDAFFALDDEWRFTHLNGYAADIMERSAEALVGRVIWEEFPEDRWPSFSERLHEAMGTQQSDSFELYAEDFDVWLECNVYPSETGLSVYFRDITDRKRREQELQRKERRFQAIFEDPNILVGLLDTDGTVLDINQTAMDYVDVDLDAVTGERFWETPWWGGGEEVRENVREWTERAAGGEYVDFETDLTRPDGDRYTLNGVFRPVTNDDGDVVSVIVSDRDISERVERERQLEESERRYRALAEHFPNGLVTLFDHDLRYTLAAGQGFDRIPVEPAELEGHLFTEVWDESTSEALEPLFEAVLSGEEVSVDLEYADREWIVHGVPITDEHGDVFAGMTMAQDVTEQVERERELERALDLLEKTERIADVGGWEIDVATDAVFWTDHIFELLEVEAEEEPSLDEALSMYHDEDRGVVEDAIDESISSGEPFDVEVRLRTAATGEERWLRLQGAPEVEDGTVVVLRGAVQDVTERKHREQRLEELVEELEVSNERLEQFAYAASHDLQEPLRMVSSYLQLVEGRYAEELDEDGREFIEFAVDGAERMREMISGLLQYSRVDTRGDPFESVDLDDVLDDVRDDLTVSIEESDAEIEVEDLPTVEGDAGQLRQVFQNLLENAIEYSGDEPPRIHVDAARTGRRWRIDVTDEGIGIDPGDAERVFEVFQSLHTPEEHTGTGIGLAICERIVERHGGEIWVDSDPGAGSTFSFTLPAVGSDG